jgi:hypothetical protein
MFQVGKYAVPMLDVLGEARIEIVEELAGFRHLRPETREFCNALLLLRNVPPTLGNMPLGLLQALLEHLAVHETDYSKLRNGAI